MLSWPAFIEVLLCHNGLNSETERTYLLNVRWALSIFLFQRAGLVTWMMYVICQYGPGYILYPMT